MSLTQGNQALIVCHHLRVFLQILPRQLIDAVGRIVTVVHTLLVAQHFLAAEHERHTLRGEHGGLRKQIEANQFLLGNARNAGFQSVDQAHIIVAAHVCHHLGGLERPRRFAVVHLRIIHLRVLNAAHNTCFNAFHIARLSGEESTLVVVVERSAECIAHIVAESGNARHLIGVDLHRQFFDRISASAATPSFAIDKHIFRERLTDEIHGFNIVNTHQIHTESIEVVFFSPIVETLNHVLAHERLVAGCFVVASGTVAIRAIGILAIESVGVGALEIAVFNIHRVVIHHIENHGNTGIVERLHHLLKFAHTHFRLKGIGRIGAFGHVVVERVVAPIELRAFEVFFIHRSIVERREQVNSRDAQILQVLNRPRLRERQEFARIASLLTAHRKIAVMGFIHNDVGGSVTQRLIFFPTFGISGSEVDYGGALAIHPHRLGKESRCFAQLFAVLGHIKGIELTLQVAFHHSSPIAITGFRHCHLFHGFSPGAISVDIELHRLCFLSHQRERGALFAIGHLVVELGIHAQPRNHCHK